MFSPMIQRTYAASSHSGEGGATGRASAKRRNAAAAIIATRATTTARPRGQMLLLTVGERHISAGHRTA